MAITATMKVALGLVAHRLVRSAIHLAGSGGVSPFFFPRNSRSAATTSSAPKTY